MATTATRATTKKIAPGAYQALSEALAVIYWNRRCFESFLRMALREHPELLVGLNFNDIKRINASQLVERLAANEPRYRQVTLALMVEVSEMETFTNLEQQEDARLLVPKAKAAVAELRHWTQKYKQDIEARSRFEAKLTAVRKKVERSQAFSRSLQDLKARFVTMHGAEDVHQRGRDLERFLYELFSLYDFNPRKGRWAHRVARPARARR
jgi:hypothetical protein